MAALVAPVSAAPEEPASTLPPANLHARLSGEVTPLPGGPVLTWALQLMQPGAGEGEAVLTLTGDGLAVRATGRVDLMTRSGRWRLDEANVDLAVWLPALNAKLGGALDGIEIAGTAVLSGEGELHDGLPTGIVNVVCADAAVNYAKIGWRLDGVTVRAAVDVSSLPDGEVPVTATIQTITSARFGARSFAMAGTLRGLRALEVTSAAIEIAGGEIHAEPFVAKLDPIEMRARLHMSRVGLQDVVALVPTAGLASATGRIGGDVTLAWTPAGGFEIGDGALRIDPSEPTILKLTPASGFLTSQVPLRIELAPWLPKPLRKLFSPINPAYETLQKIELGKADLRVESLEASLTPSGDGQGRTASVAITARPVATDSLIKVVTFQVNLAGPLVDVLKMGAGSNLSISTR